MDERAGGRRPVIEAGSVCGLVFDFYDTLVYVDERGPRGVRQEMLAALGVPEDAFARVWREGRDRRMAGHGGSLAQQLGEALAKVGVGAPAALLKDFAAKDIAALLSAVGVYPGVRDALRELRRRGYRLGLLSNCSYTGALVLDHLSFWSFFDAVVLSYSSGLLKPDPAIYLKACRTLALAPRRCAFVGDGGFGELDAAHRLGMLALRVTQERQSPDYGSSSYADHDITSISDLLDLFPSLEAVRDSG
ncbi:MAG: HAD family hydrolase [Bacteroidetes bacterium]|nr:HAD family hydrolase [Bacteroidota bacterium]MCL5026859.1 HAD family hydrolase [Chloroflexota bacterium]